MSTNKQTKPLRTLFLTLPALLLGIVLLGVLVSPSAAANPAPVGVFYVTEPEDDILPALVTISGGTTPTSPMKTTISIAISADNTLVYYDHWEDGFANDIANPTAGEIYANPGNLDGVQIWGDADTSNGAPPGFPGDVLNSGNVIIMQNDVAVPNTAATIQYDGKDKIGGTNAIAVSRMIFASSTLSVLAYANAMFPTTDWGDEYTAPVGCNTSGTQMFEYSAFSITASRNDTTVQIDADANGAFETSVVLDEGETYLEDGFSQTGCDYVRQGAKVRSTDPDKPIQVVHLTGDIGSEYASRDFNMVPDDQLSYSYWMPVGNSTNAGDTRLYIYNPSATNLFVRCESIDGPDAGTTADSWNVTIAAGAVDSTITLSDNQAVHCFAVTAAGGTTMDTSREFNGLATIDWDERTYDWGIPFLPDDALSNQALVGLGQGRDTTASNDPDDNGSPLWVTPICTTFFYVDWNNDGTPDLVDFNGDGDTTDNDVDGSSTLDEPTSNNGFSVDPGRSVRLYDPTDGDQSGAYIFTKTAANNGGTGGCSFAAAWGEDPRVAGAGSPYLDVGTIVVSLPSLESSKAASLLTDADQNGVISPGDTISYLITIENTGLSIIADVSVNDDIPTNTTYVLNSTEKDVGGGWVAIPDDGSGTEFPLDDPDPDGVSLGAMAIGATFLVRFDVTVDMMPAGDPVDITNCARIAFSGTARTVCTTTEVLNPPAPALTLDKTTTTANYDSVGDTISYSYLLTNSGNVPLTPPYAVSDNKITNPNTVTCPQTPNPLPVGDSITCTATYTVTQADINNGSVTNIATASAQYGGNPVNSNQDTVTVPLAPVAGLNVVKSSTTTLITAAGQQVPYTFTVTNTGNVPLNNVTVSDPKCDLPPTGPTGDTNNNNKLDLTETWVYTCIHTVTQAEMDAGGSLLNTVTADSTETDPATDDLSIPIQQRPGLSVVKSSTTQLITQAGQQVVYTFDVTNTGNISLTGVTVSDPKCDAAPTGPMGDTNNDGQLGLLETWVYTCIHTVTQAELDAATGPNPQLHNVVTADSTETPPATDDLDIPIQYNPGLNVVKSSTTALITAAGQQVPYTFTVTNTGNVTLTNVTVSDAKCDAAPVLQPGGDVNNDGKLQVIETWIFTCLHTVTQAEMNAGGNLVNTVTADSTETPPDTDDLSIPIQQTPALTLDKDTTTVNYDSVGDTIAYTYKVTNTGNVSLTPPYSVTDNKIVNPNTVTCQQTPNPLNPGDFFTCTATYTVTQADLDAGSVTNLATGSAQNGQIPVISNDDTVTVPAVQTPLLEVTKTPNKTVVASGDLVTFTILVENKGTITLSLNSLIDSIYGDITTTGHDGITATTCDVTPPVVLAALTGTYTCTFTAAVTGNPPTTHTNTVTACDTTKNPDVCDSGDATVNIIPDPAIEVIKTANPTQVYAPGGPVVFTVVINNTGGGTVNLTSLTDNVYGNITQVQGQVTATTCAVPQSISQGGNYQCQFTANVTGAAGTIHTDVVTGSGTGFNGDPVSDNDDAVVNIIAPPIVNTCPVNAATHRWTDILGIGMGSNTKHKAQAKLVIPNSANVVELYGQLAAKNQGAAKYVRFIYPNNQYVEMAVPTSPAPRTWGVLWYGADLNPSAHIRGRWFLQTSGTKGHIPRAFVLYPTYNNPNQEYVNVFEVINTSDSQVYWNVAEGWIPSQQLVIDIPAPLARVNFNVELAVVDNDKDARPVIVTVTAGGVTQTQSPVSPNKGDLLNILSFTLANVPAGTGEIVITITSPDPYTNGLGALGGDSAAITGVTANYLCQDVQVTP